MVPVVPYWPLLSILSSALLATTLQYTVVLLATTLLFSSVILATTLACSIALLVNAFYLQ